MDPSEATKSASHPVPDPIAATEIITQELQIAQIVLEHESKLGTVKDTATGESSGTPYYLRSATRSGNSGISRSSQSDV